MRLDDLKILAGSPPDSLPDRTDIKVTDRNLAMAAMTDRTGGITIREGIVRFLYPGFHLRIGFFQRIDHRVQNELYTPPGGQQFQRDTSYNFV